jgi:hypothetical protein
MAEQEQGADWTPPKHRRGMQALWRLAGWGSLATIALFVAVITAYSSAGSQRQAPVDPGTHARAGEAPPRLGDNADDSRRLMETVQTLAADRDQAFARIAALERSLDSITGTIKRAQQQSQAVQAPPQLSVQPAPVPAVTAIPSQEQPAATPRAEPPPIQVAVASEQVTYPQRQQAAPAPPVVADATRLPASDGANRQAAIASTQGRSVPPVEPASAGLGLDIGGAINYEGLRTLWHSTKGSDVPLTDELYPLVAVHENNKTHGIDLRLVVGPIDDMETAARLCAALSAAHRYCQPVAFEGQRLTLNDPPGPKVTPAHRPMPKPDPNAKTDFKPDTKPDAKADGNPFSRLIKPPGT